MSDTNDASTDPFRLQLEVVVSHEGALDLKINLKRPIDLSPKQRDRLTLVRQLLVTKLIGESVPEVDDDRPNWAKKVSE